MTKTATAPTPPLAQGQLGWSGGCVAPARVQITFAPSADGACFVTWSRLNASALPLRDGDGDVTLSPSQWSTLTADLIALRPLLAAAPVTLPMTSSVTTCWVELPWLPQPLRLSYVDGAPGPPPQPIMQAIDSLTLTLQRTPGHRWRPQRPANALQPSRITRLLKWLLRWTWPLWLYLAWVLFWGVGVSALRACG
jgi:hypothetical protein